MTKLDVFFRHSVVRPYRFSRMWKAADGTAVGIGTLLPTPHAIVHATPIVGDLMSVRYRSLTYLTSLVRSFSRPLIGWCRRRKQTTSPWQYLRHSLVTTGPAVVGRGRGRRSCASVSNNSPIFVDISPAILISRSSATSPIRLRIAGECISKIFTLKSGNTSSIECVTIATIVATIV